MSFGIDVNILLYASDKNSPHHSKAASFLENCANGGEVFCLAWLTLTSYLRIATHPAIFVRPLSHDDALRNVETLVASPMCRVVGEEDGFWVVYRRLTSEVPTRGNLVPDAHLAAVMLQQGVVRLYTHDRDFRKFSALRVIDPFD
jgi:toxin-antitoxin system PIN domain toxin